jgi:uncharacterized protein (DUF736 family)
MKNRSLIPCGIIQKSKNDYTIAKFRTLIWLLNENEHYERDIEAEFPNEYYQAQHNVPKYKIFHNKENIGWAFPRVDRNGEDFLFVFLKKKRRNYYIFDIDEKYNINMNANVYFDIRGDYY